MFTFCKLKRFFIFLIKILNIHCFPENPFQFSINKKTYVFKIHYKRHKKKMYDRQLEHDNNSLFKRKTISKTRKNIPNSTNYYNIYRNIMTNQENRRLKATIFIHTWVMVFPQFVLVFFFFPTFTSFYCTLNASFKTLKFKRNCCYIFFYGNITLIWCKI